METTTAVLEETDRKEEIKEIPSLLSVLDLIKSEAWRCYQRINKSEWDFDDLVQHGVFQYYYTAKMWRPGKGMAFSSLLVMNLRLEFINRIKSSYSSLSKRRTIDDSDFVYEEKIRPAKLEDVVGKENLSENAKLILKCIFEPPDEFKEVFSFWQSTHKSWKNCLRKVICNFLRISDSDFVNLSKEIRSKTVLSI